MDNGIYDLLILAVLTVGDFLSLASKGGDGIVREFFVFYF